MARVNVVKNRGRATGADAANPEYAGILPRPPKGAPPVPRRCPDVDLSLPQQVSLALRSISELAGLLQAHDVPVQDYLDTNQLGATAAILKHQEAKKLVAEGVIAWDGSVNRGQPLPEIRAVATLNDGPPPPDLLGPGINSATLQAEDDYRRRKAEWDAQSA